MAAKNVPKKPWDSKYKRLVHRIVKKIDAEILCVTTRNNSDKFPSLEQCDAAIFQVYALMCFSPPISRSGRVKCQQDLLVYRGLARAWKKLKIMRKMAEVAHDNK